MVSADLRFTAPHHSTASTWEPGTSLRGLNPSLYDGEAQGPPHFKGKLHEVRLKKNVVVPCAQKTPLAKPYTHVREKHRGEGAKVRGAA